MTKMIKAKNNKSLKEIEEKKANQNYAKNQKVKINDYYSYETLDSVTWVNNIKKGVEVAKSMVKSKGFSKTAQTRQKFKAEREKELEEQKKLDVSNIIEPELETPSQVEEIPTKANVEKEKTE